MAQAPQIVPMSVTDTEIDGLVVITVRAVTDDRGTVREFYRQSSWVEAGLPDLGPWAQLNVTETRQGALRGLHGETMTKLVGIVAGEAFGVYADTRQDSPSYGKVVTQRLTPGTQVLVPQGVCNGFQSVSEGVTQYLYSFDAEWVPGMAGTALTPLDPYLGVAWPIAVDTDDRTQISEKDFKAPTFGG
ncbi:MAG TPA: dTDP-4-dehydrorhamnose 3,5-epimerase [Pseudonocardiaceae bacterium]|jgi:dTDP-4-dehydrorhamnose 3,5-epimerase|nr:dTDP-4-dehydrorhamnose 3,5-epimerase [Pseudonocardiaceae bacterium]